MLPLILLRLYYLVSNNKEIQDDDNKNGPAIIKKFKTITTRENCHTAVPA